MISRFYILLLFLVFFGCTDRKENTNPDISLLDTVPDVQVAEDIVITGKYASVDSFIPFVMKWEGGFALRASEPGGAVNMGITMSTWKRAGYDKNNDGVIDIEDLRLISSSDVIGIVLKPYYWDKWRADSITDQSVANMLVDWLWCSGVQGIKRPQSILGVAVDGIAGYKTLSAINNYDDYEALFYKLKIARLSYIDTLCILNPGKSIFKRGWINRINDLKYSGR
jgi:lysozyme family protein